MSLLPGFMKGQSDNLPKIDSMTLFSFLGNNQDFMGAEVRGIKAERSGREGYGDNAIGYVQVKREMNLCTVNAKVTPEHSTSKKAYNVALSCNEVDKQILSVSCGDCAASEGGCKHQIALLMWLHRRSEEPAVTSVKCYWKSSNLSAVGKSIKFIKAKDLCKNVPPLSSGDGSFFNVIMEQSKREQRYDCTLSKYFKVKSDVEKLSVHYLLSVFFSNKQGNSAEDFIDYCRSQMCDTTCNFAEHSTVQQSESALWHELRYARITASKAHEAAHCRTYEGSLVETILGAKGLKDSTAMKRGRHLEKDVRRIVQKEKAIKINASGLKLSPEHPIMGASPDGISEDFVIEIKCPMSKKAVESYVKNGEIVDKYRAQIQLQMFFCKKKRGLFCIADTDFETSKKVSIINVDYNEQYCLDLIENCTIFWKIAIFPMLNKSLN